MQNGAYASAAGLGSASVSWSIQETGDFNGDGKSDILWIDNSGNVCMWLMNGTQISSITVIGHVGTAWGVQSLNAN